MGLLKVKNERLQELSQLSCPGLVYLVSSGLNFKLDEIFEVCFKLSETITFMVNNHIYGDCVITYYYLKVIKFMIKFKFNRERIVWN